MGGFILPFYLHIKAAYKLTQMVLFWRLDMGTSNFLIQSK
jgi:hypothetical protein